MSLFMARLVIIHGHGSSRFRIAISEIMGKLMRDRAHIRSRPIMLVSDGLISLNRGGCDEAFSSLQYGEEHYRGAPPATDNIRHEVPLQW